MEQIEIVDDLNCAKTAYSNNLRQRLEENHYERQILFKFAQAAILVVSRRGCIIETNHYFHQLTGYSDDELAGLPIKNVIAPIHNSQEGARLSLDADATDTIHINIICKNRLNLPFQLTKVPIRRDHTPCILLFLRSLIHPHSHVARQSVYAANKKDTLRAPVEIANQIIGASEPIQNLCILGSKVAQSDCTLLIQGESGTGKEIFAKAVHRCSRRNQNPFVGLNCVAISDTLFESELFGHVKGAFTGAIRDRKGRFQQAQYGTLLLDEIGSMSLVGQAKLLRVLQEKEFEPVGSSQTVQCDVRIITTTNVDLREAVAAGQFREDLYYRLSVMTMELPPLRDRKEDIPLLADFFLERYAGKMHRGFLTFSPETIAALLAYDWPGNVRELKNIVEQCVVISDGPEIDLANLPMRLMNCADRPTPSENKDLCLRDHLNIIERHIVMHTLKKTNWVKKKAARDLGIDPRNFNYFLKKHCIPPPNN